MEQSFASATRTSVLEELHEHSARAKRCFDSQSYSLLETSPVLLSRCHRQIALLLACQFFSFRLGFTGHYRTLGAYKFRLYYNEGN